MQASRKVVSATLERRLSRQVLPFYPVMRFFGNAVADAAPLAANVKTRLVEQKPIVDGAPGIVKAITPMVHCDSPSHLR